MQQNITLCAGQTRDRSQSTVAEKHVVEASGTDDHDAVVCWQKSYQ